MANNNPRVLAREWFKKAYADLDFALIGLKQTEHYAEVCFLCQQAAEKCLKGYLVFKNIRPSKIHSTAVLLKKCIKFSDEFSNYLTSCKILDRYYIPTRYPTPERVIYKKSDAQEALEIAEAITKLTGRLVG